jgi:hypothetical protein
MYDFIIIILMSLAWSAYFAAKDAESIRLEQEIHHGQLFGLRFVIIYMIAAYFHDGSPLLFVVRFAVSYLTFYLAFDPILNKLRGKDIFYIGTTAKFDRFARLTFPTYTGQWVYGIEAVLLIAAVTLYFIIL